MIDVADPIRHLDVCAGIGGFSLGLQLAMGPGVRTVGYVERDAYCAAVLLARMEDQTLERAPLWCGEIQDLDAGELRGQVDLLTAGFPCQPYSSAGLRLHEADERAIWPEIARLCGETAVPLVLLENVSRSALRGPWRDLQDLGYTVPHPIVVSAAELGAGHHQRRWFALAYRDDQDIACGELEEARDQGRADPDPDQQLLRLQPGRGRGADGAQAAQPGTTAGDGDGQGQSQPSRRLRTKRRRSQHPAWWAAEPRVARVLHGVPARMDRERALGNAVVPAVVTAAWKELTR